MLRESLSLRSILAILVCISLFVPDAKGLMRSSKSFRSLWLSNPLNRPRHTCVMTKVRSLAESATCNFIEWIEYHATLGVDYFYVSDECSPQPDLAKVFQFYEDIHLLENPTKKRDCTDYVPNESQTTNQTFSKFTSKQCDWIATIDMDEYLNIAPENLAQNLSLANSVPSKAIDLDLKKILGDSIYPFIRLPWWIVGSDDNEKRPQGFVEDNYLHGNLNLYSRKSMARNGELRGWVDQHRPYVRSENKDNILYDNVTFEDYTWSLPLYPDEYVTVIPRPLDAEPITRAAKDLINTLSYPTNRLFLKHYVYLSLEEFKEQRAAQATMASSGRNVWAENPEDKWRVGGHDYGAYVHLFNEPFRHKMSKKMKASLRTRMAVAELYHPEVVPTFEMCKEKYWGDF